MTVLIKKPLQKSFYVGFLFFEGMNNIWKIGRLNMDINYEGGCYNIIRSQLKIILYKQIQSGSKETLC